MLGDNQSKFSFWEQSLVARVDRSKKNRGLGISYELVVMALGYQRQYDRDGNTHHYRVVPGSWVNAHGKPIPAKILLDSEQICRSMKALKDAKEPLFTEASHYRKRSGLRSIGSLYCMYPSGLLTELLYASYRIPVCVSQNSSMPNQRQRINVILLKKG